MRYTVILCPALVLAACSKAPVTRDDSPPVDSAAEFLLASAAADFHAHPPTDPLHFRDVHVAHLKTSTGEEQYMLCGQFVPGQEPGSTRGTPFVTIKTSDYEHYIGAQAAAKYCQRPSVVWDEGDLSTSLQSRFDSLSAR